MQAIQRHLDTQGDWRPTAPILHLLDSPQWAFCQEEQKARQSLVNSLNSTLPGIATSYSNLIKHPANCACCPHLT